MDRNQVVAEIGLVDFFAQINTRSAEPNTEGTRQRRLRITGIRAQVIRMIAPDDTQGASCIKTKHPSRNDHKTSGQASWNKIRQIVKARGEFAEVKVSFGVVANHRVESADGLVGHGQRHPAKKKIKDRRDDSVARAFGQRFQTGTED